ncbi:MAG: BREX-3 system phosphatase PglZ [Acidimicrobiales bacterium]
MLDDPPDLTALQDEWTHFAERTESSWAGDFEAARAEIGQLFAVGELQPVLGSAEFPSWATMGVRLPTNEERAWKLMGTPPAPFPPSDAAGWPVLAEWWGDLRRLVAVATPDLRERAWDVWAEIDMAFLPWLRDRYGSVLSSSARWPPALHRVAPFLARRLRDGTTQRVLLIVLDGMGHAQWAHLREQLSLRVLESGSTFALVPTYTTVSRQAIFAADLPVTFPESLWSTQPERRRWEAFWTAEGLPVTAVAYHRVRGRFPHDHVDFGAARAIGLVVNAVDDLMHTSELFGDAQFLANLNVWVANGFLDDLVQRADAVGIEVWITADHGNLECLPARALKEGVAVESAGKRLLRYPNRILRDASTADGIVWNDIPGLPESAEPLLLAPGRLAFTNNQLSVSHGGLSIDEVIVPLVRVAP